MPSYLESDLQFHGYSLAELAEAYPTPFFVISEKQLQDNYASLERGLSASGSQATIRYCAKTNNEAGILKVLASCGSGVLVSHAAEAELAIGCGFIPETVAFQKPVLDEGELTQVIEMGVRFFHAYRLSDLDIFNRVSIQTGSELKVSLRLRNGNKRPTVSPIGMITKRMGFGSTELLQAAGYLSTASHLDLSAINFYIGTQQTSPNRYYRLLVKAISLSAQIQHQYKLSVQEINLGGGIPAPTVQRLGFRSLWRRVRISKSGDLRGDAQESFVRELSEQFSRGIAEANLTHRPAIAIEPGRSIVGDAAILVTRVQAVQGRWIFLDASRNYLGENPILFTRRVLHTEDHEKIPGRLYHLSGSSLNTTDVIDLWRKLPIVAKGDVLALCDAGAYSISRSNRYASLAPMIIMLKTDGSTEMIRRREQTVDLIGPMTSKLTISPPTPPNES